MTDVYLVTGATGFIGQHVVSALVHRGNKVVGIGLPEDNQESLLWNDLGLRVASVYDGGVYDFSNHDVLLRFGDVANAGFVKNLFKELVQQNLPVRFVLHFAACATIQRALAQCRRAWAVNHVGTQNVLGVVADYARAHPGNVRGFFHASTDKVYGEGTISSYHETDELRPLNYPYDMSKAAADKYVRAIAPKLDFPAVLYRFCNVYGPADIHKSRIVPGTLYRLMYTDQAPVLRKYMDDGGHLQVFRRDMIYVADLVNAIMRLVDAADAGGIDDLGGAVFNLGSGHCYSIEDVIRYLIVHSGASIAPRQEIMPSGEIKIQSMDYEKLNARFGFKPRYTLSDGVAETVRWYLQHKEGMYGRFR